MREPELDRGAMLDADQAFIDSQLRGETKARSVRAAIKAYLKSEQEPTTWPVRLPLVVEPHD